MRFLSLFSGMEAASVAFSSLGWQAVAFAEIDPAACRVLQHHYPEVPNLGDISKISEEQVRGLGHIDLVCFGSPCQDLSLAGKRAGLAGERSGLFFYAVDIVRWSGARFALFENVPGLFSSNEGRDFSLVVGALAGMECDVPKDGWENTGVALGRDALVEWGVLDAQWFGVPQRRRRIFALRDTGDWHSRSPLLFDAESLRGDTPPRREARQATAGEAVSGVEIGPAGGRFTETSNAHGGTGRIDFESEPFVTGPLCHSGRAASSATQQDAESGMLIASPLTSNPYADRASEEANLICVHGSQDPIVSHQAFPVGRNQGQETVIVFRASGQEGYTPSPICPPLTSTDGGGTVPTVAVPHAVAFKASHYTRDKDGAPSEITPPLSADADKGDQDTLVFETRFVRNGRGAPDRVAAPLKAESGQTGKGDGAPCTTDHYGVRRLTPLECLRLQGYPDDYLNIPGLSDSAKYKMIGNSWAIPVVRYIGERINEVEKALRGERP